MSRRAIVLLIATELADISIILGLGFDTFFFDPRLGSILQIKYHPLGRTERWVW